MIQKTLLNECLEAFANARGKIIDALESLWAVHENNAWEGRYNSFSEFCESGLKISRSTGSKYIKVYEHYIKNASLTIQQLRDADVECLYLALGTEGTPEKQYSNALTLSRAELKDEAVEGKFGSAHEHTFGEERWAKCTVCDRFVRV